jgi:hypothetical protein
LSQKKKRRDPLSHDILIYYLWFMVFNATFNTISVISWQSVFLVEETGVPRENHWLCRKSQINFITSCCIKYSSPWKRFELTTLVLIGTDCTGSCKSNYHMVTTKMAPYLLVRLMIYNRSYAICSIWFSTKLVYSDT